MEVFIATIGEYSYIVAPSLVWWAILSLYVQPRESNSTYSQATFFAAMIAIGILTTRSMLLNEQHWLVNAVSLGILIVGGALRRPVEGPSTVWSN